MKSLYAGYERFRQGYWQEHKARYAQLAREGQAPSTMVIACADSRVSPEVIFDAAPGDIFVVRNVSNLVPPYAPDTGNHGTSAALEFAVNGLQVQRIIVLGHSLCGGIRALMQDRPAQDDFIGSWMRIAEPARRRVCEAPDAPTDFPKRCARCERESIRVSLANLRSFPWIAERIAQRQLKLVGLHFDVENASLEVVEGELPD